MAEIRGETKFRGRRDRVPMNLSPNKNFVATPLKK